MPIDDASIILAAAGYSRRMGQWKPAVEYRGKPLIHHALKAALLTPWPVILVGGHNFNQLSALVEAFLEKHPQDKNRLSLIEAKDFEAGPGASLLAGIREADSKWIFLSLGDLPHLSQEHYEKLFRQRIPPACRPVYRGKPGHPVLISNEIVSEIEKKYSRRTGDIEISMRELMGEITPLNWDDPAVITDMDIPEK